MSILNKINTLAPKNADKKKIKIECEKLKEKLILLQDKLIASKSHAVLVIFQGMDASGKDGAAKKVSLGLNPVGLSYKAFKAPSKEELSHDFLWRIHKEIPEKGIIGFFNRSHYEDVLIQRVHQWHPESVFQERFEQINNFEKMLIENNVIILKCYMHVSKEEQLRDLTDRKNLVEKMWKHNDNDWIEREKWSSYMQCYEDVFEKCNTVKWHIIPCDNNWYKEYMITKILVDTLEKLNLKYPVLEKIDIIKRKKENKKKK
jgi:PPK2 family polyphosphate:nucleotide phosphotransferase